MKTIFEKVFIYIIVSLVMIFSFKWWYGSFEWADKDEDTNIMVKVKDMEGVNTENLIKEFGKPKEVHKDKVYTYADQNATYDFLIDGTVKSVVVSIKDSKQFSDIDQLLENMGLKVSLDLFEEEVVVNDKKSRKGYDIGSISDIDIISNKESNKIEKVKITY